MFKWLKGRNASIGELLREATALRLNGEHDRAYRTAREAARLDDMAKVVLAQWMLFDDDREDVKAEGISLLERAAKKGSVPAKSVLSSCYLDGVGVSQDVRKALALTVEAAEAGDLQSQLDVLRLLDERPELDDDVVLARRMVELAAANGMPELREALEADLANRSRI